MSVARGWLIINLPLASHLLTSNGYWSDGSQTCGVDYSIVRQLAGQWMVWYAR